MPWFDLMVLFFSPEFCCEYFCLGMKQCVKEVIRNLTRFCLEVKIVEQRECLTDICKPVFSSCQINMTEIEDRELKGEGKGS